MEEQEKPENAEPMEEDLEEPPHADLPMGDGTAGFSKHGKRLLDPDVVKRMKDAGLPRPADVSSISWTQLQHLQVGRHHVIAYMLACGASQKSIAEAVGMEPNSICNIANSEKMKFEVSRLQHKLFGADAKKRFQGLMPKAINTIEEIMDDKKEKGSVRLSAATEIVDRSIGKAAQTINVEGSLIRQLYEKLDDKQKVIDTEPVSRHPDQVMEEIMEDCGLASNPNEVEHRDPNDNPNEKDGDDKIEEWVGENF